MWHTVSNLMKWKMEKKKYDINENSYRVFEIWTYIQNVYVTNNTKCEIYLHNEFKPMCKMDKGDEIFFSSNPTREFLNSWPFT